MSIPKPSVRAEIEEAHKQELEIMNFLRNQGLSDKKSRKKQSGGFIMNTAKNVRGMTRFFTTMVMIYRGKSGQAIEGYVEKFFPESEKKRLVDAGKDAAKFLEIAKAKTGGGVETRSKSSSSEKRSDENEEEESAENIYTGEKNEKGEKHGIGKMEYKNGDVYEGHWSDGLRDGKGKITFLNNSSYDGNWSKDQISGRGVYRYFNGNVYDGQFESGVATGHGIMTYLSGDRYVGDWKKGRRHGEGKMFYKNGEFFVGHWKKDKREGEGKYVDASGNVLIEGEYEDDQAPFDVSNIKTKFTKADNLIGKAGQTLDSVINSPNVKMFKEKLKQVTDSLPAVPDYTTLGKYTLSITTIFSYVLYLFTSKDTCTPMAQTNPAHSFFFCALLENAFKLFSSSLKIIAFESQTSIQTLINQLGITAGSISYFAPIFLYIFAIGLSGFFILMFYFAWTYINKDHEDREKVIKKARSSSRRNSSSSSSPRKTEKRR